MAGHHNEPLPAGPSDLIVLHDLICAVDPESWSRERLAGELARPDSLGFWIPEQRRAVALSMGRVVVDELHVLDVAVASTHRRRGAGRRVMDALMAGAIRRGCRVALLELRESNAAAQALYAQAGFVVAGRRPRYYPGGEAATLMTRTLAASGVAPSDTTPGVVQESASNRRSSPLSSPMPEPGPPIRALAEVLDNQREGASNYRLSLAVEGWPGAEPGQFLMISAGAVTATDRSDPLLPRPMAIYRGHARVRSGAARIDILYKATGRGTRLLAEALPGQRVRVVGPLGRAFPPVVAPHRALLVGGGTGIASLFELAARTSAGGLASVVVLGARTADDLMGVDDFRRLGVDLRLATEDGSVGTHGRVTDILRPLLAEHHVAQPIVYACGPTPMMRACAEMAAGSAARCIVSLENNMACGFGVCLGCAVPVVGGGFSLVWRAGPIFDAGDVAWAGLP
jgi:dihydroorotate dehydrogenase electron transfer subunit